LTTSLNWLHIRKLCQRLGQAVQRETGALKKEFIPEEVAES